MKAHIVDNGVVTNSIEVESLDFMLGLIDGETGGIGWLWNGENLTPPPEPVKSPEQLQAEVVEATQKRLDEFAQTRNYDGIMSLCTYATSTNAKFQAEGQYGVEARDATWSKLYAILAEVEAGTRPAPAGYLDIESELPLLQWPE